MEENDLVKRLVGQGTQTLLSSHGEKDEAAGVRYGLAFLGVLGFIGAEGTKVIFRTGFGVKAISSTRVTICSLLFLLIAIAAFYISENYVPDPDYKDLGSPSSMLVTAIIYLISSLAVFRKGQIEQSKANADINPYYNGKSVWFKFLTDEGWSESKVQNMAEPLLLIAVGTFSLLYNVLLAIPLIWCGLSIWITLFVKRLWGTSPTAEILE